NCSYSSRSGPAPAPPVTATRQNPSRSDQALLVVAAPGSAAGKYSDGNTGRARVGINTPVPIPDDLAALLRGAGVALQPWAQPAEILVSRSSLRGATRTPQSLREHLSRTGAVPQPWAAVLTRDDGGSVGPRPSCG
ncbi:DUF3703 domain-containing protein, partial [Streptomyces sp. NPDC057496]|uniref:DUF3703 domain-containing protein n=1 Tax=Streptomyces sp. NPDC057496 TaxID=3346149 RepID=UPI00369BF204